MKIKNKKTLFSVIILFFFLSSLIGISSVSSQSAHRGEVVGNIPHVSPRLTELLRPSEVPNFNDSVLDPCPTPEREPRFIYRENVVHEERQFRAEHSGCGGDILMRKWQIVGLEVGTCTDESPGPDCDVQWLDEYVAYYDRYVPEEEGVIFDEVGSWQKAWPPTDTGGGTNPEDAWRTEHQLMEEYGEPVPFPTCQSDCLQAPPGVPGELGDYNQEDPYYFNNPWLPDLIGGEDPENIEELREYNVLGGNNPLNSVPLPTKLFWWNIPGWHEGWIEDNEFKECEGPEDIACVNSYIIRFDNINREDRPPKLYRDKTVYRVKEELLQNYPGQYDRVEAYKRAQRIFNDLENAFSRSYEEYRRHTKDTRRVDGIRYDRDNILHCDECGGELEVWLDENKFNPLEYDPIIDYEREHRDWMLAYLLDELPDKRGHIYQVVTEEEQDDFVDELIEDEFKSYGRPAFFRSGAEHSYSLQAACSPHDYLEKSSEMERGEGRWGPRATFSFQAHDGPELISPLDPNWVSPYHSKEYEPNHNESRVRTGEDHDHYGDERIDGYRYPAEEYPDGFNPTPSTPGTGTPGAGGGGGGGGGAGGNAEDPGEEDPEEGEFLDSGLTAGEPEEDPNNPGMECSTSGLRKGDAPQQEVIDRVSVGGRTHQELYANWLLNQGIDPDLADEIASAGGVTTIPPVFEEGDHLHCWKKMIPTAEVVKEVNNWFHLTSTYRDEDHNFSSNVRGSQTSYHMRNNAIDLQRGRTNSPNQELYWELDNLLNDNVGRLTWYPKVMEGGDIRRGSFVHIDTRPQSEGGGWRSHIHDNNSPIYEEENPLASSQNKNLASNLNYGRVLGSATGGSGNYMQETVSFKDWLEENDYEFIWNEDPESLVLQDAVPFRENLEWAQIWYQQNPDRDHHHPASPARMYQLSLGDSYRVTEDTTSHSDPVLEWCHPQLTRTFKERPICDYFKVSRGTGEQVRNYAMPTREDRTIEYFFLPEDDEEEERVYSWSVAACRESDESYCTNYSQMWRFQIDQNEEERLFAPRSLNPKNIALPQVDDDDGTVGFPFYIEWDRSFGVDSYVYRLREEGSSWDDVLDASIQREREVRYSISDLEDNIFELDTAYEWDIKACWDEKVNHGQDNPQDILNWAEANKSETCTNWRSEDFGDAPFQFRTTGRPPEIIYPEENEKGTYPVTFDWESVPGAESYALIVCEKGLLSTCNLIYANNAQIGALTPESSYTYPYSIRLDREYELTLHSCAEGVDELKQYYHEPDPDFDVRNIDDILIDSFGLSCYTGDRANIDFEFQLEGPNNLRPGTDDPSEPEFTSLEDSIKTISWEKIENVDYYQVEIRKDNTNSTSINTVHAEDYDFPGKELIRGNNLTYDFSEYGNYEISVKGCLKPAVVGDDCAQGMLGEATTTYLHVGEIEPDYDGLIRGIVPCGTQVDNPNLDWDTTESCNPGHLFVLFLLIIEEVIFKVIFPLSLFFLLLYTGYLYYTSLGDPKTMQKVFKVWEGALKGYLLIFLAWVIVGLLLALLGYQASIFGEWSEITDI